MVSLESLERTLTRFQRQDLHVVEHRPARALVAAHDILRTDGLGRSYIAVPAGHAPASWVDLTDDERRQLVDAPPPKPHGYLNPGHAGFTPEGVVMGGIVVEE
jgi:hypothetical protein